MTRVPPMRPGRGVGSQPDRAPSPVNPLSERALKVLAAVSGPSTMRQLHERSGLMANDIRTLPKRGKVTRACTRGSPPQAWVLLRSLGRLIFPGRVFTSYWVASNLLDEAVEVALRGHRHHQRLAVGGWDYLSRLRVMLGVGHHV